MVVGAACPLSVGSDTKTIHVDCMVGPNTSIHPPENEHDYQRTIDVMMELHNDTTSNRYRFAKWAEDFPGKPEYPEDHNETTNERRAVLTAYHANYKKWDDARLAALDQKMRTSKFGNSLLVTAANESIAAGTSTEDLEDYVSRYYSKEKALQLMRSRRVMGNCSMDQSPRIHAMKICKLAAETTHWDIFLRAHLDIMNDRFERATDGSYAWADRKTYLKELEELDIDATDLLIGSILAVSNPTSGHYYGTVHRIGAALTEAADKEAVENLLISMMQDEHLDKYNRVSVMYTFLNYAESLPDEKSRTTAVRRLDATIGGLPEDLQEMMKRKY